MIVRLAWRSIWRYRRRTIITVVSIGLGLAFALFFLTMADGIYAKIIDDVARMQAGHITIENSEYRNAPSVDLWVDDLESIRPKIDALAGVEKTKLLLLGQGVARSGSGTVGVSVMGVEPSVEAETSPLAGHIVEGNYLADDDGAMVIVGSQLARRLNLQEGKKLVISTNDAGGSLVEELCRVKGIFEMGSDEIDGYLIQAPLSFARQLYGIPSGSATQLGVVLIDPDTQDEELSHIRQIVNREDTGVYPWQEIQPGVAGYIRLDRGSNVMFQVLLMFIILFTIFNTILMSVVERQREFAVLLALGSPPAQLQYQILIESAFIGLIGCVLGLLIGGLSSYAIQVWGWDLSTLYEEGITVSGFAMSTDIHSRVTAATLLWTGGIVFVSTLILSLWPMRRAVNIPMVEVLR